MVTQASRDQHDTQRRDSTEGDQREGAGDGPVSLWEWGVAALGLVLVVGTIGFMLYRAIAGGDTPPLISVAVADIQPAGDGYLVTFTATNQGDQAAADLIVEGSLSGDDGSAETSTATLTYVPSRSQRQGGLYFTTDPRNHPLTLRPQGYELP